MLLILTLAVVEEITPRVQFQKAIVTLQQMVVFELFQFKLNPTHQREITSHEQENFARILLTHEELAVCVPQAQPACVARARAVASFLAFVFALNSSSQETFQYRFFLFWFVVP